MLRTFGALGTVLLIAFLLFGQQPAAAAVVKQWTSQELGWLECRLRGAIATDQSDVTSVRSVAISGCKAIHLDSQAGSIDAAIEIGRIVRKSQMMVVVDADSKCASACVLIFAAGVMRMNYGPVLVHRPYGEATGASLEETQ